MSGEEGGRGEGRGEEGRGWGGGGWGGMGRGWMGRDGEDGVRWYKGQGRFGGIGGRNRREWRRAKKRKK